MRSEARGSETPVLEAGPPLADILADAGRELLKAETPADLAGVLARHADLLLPGAWRIEIVGETPVSSSRAGQGEAVVAALDSGGGTLAWWPAEEAARAEGAPRLGALAALASTALSASGEIRRAREARAEAALVAQRGDRLLDVASALSRAATPEEVVGVIVEKGVAALGARAGCIARLDEDGVVRILGSVGYGEEIGATFPAVPLSQPTPLTDAVRAREPIFLRGAAERALRYPHLGRAREANGGGAMVAMPIELEGRVTGAMGLNFVEERAFTPDERAFILALARLTGQALERARLLLAERQARAQAEQATSRLALVLDASAALAEPLDYDATLETLAKLAADLLPGACTVYLREGDRLAARITRARDAETERRFHEVRSRHPHDLRAQTGLAAIHRAGRPVLVPAITEEMVRAEARDERHARDVLSLGVRSSLLVPLRAGGESVGVLVLSATGDDRAYGPDDLALAEEIARRASSALERARLMRAAREAETRLESLVRSVPGVVWEAWGDPASGDQRIGFVSDHVEAMLGHTVEEWLGTPNFWLRVVHPDDRERAAREAAEHYRRGGEGVCEFRWVAKDGRALHVLAHSVVVRDAQGRPVGMRGVTIDVSRRRETEERLRLYHRIFEASNDAIAVIGPDARYLEQNAAHRALTGYSDEELAQATPAIHLGEEAFAQLAEELGRAGRVRREVQSRTREGRVVDVDLSAFTMRDASGEVACHVGIKRDVTRRRRMESQLRDRLRELEAIYRLTDALGRAGRAEEAHAAALDCLAAALGVRRSSILLHDEQGVMRFAAWRGLSDAYRRAVEGHSAWPRDATDPQIVAIGDTRADAALAPLLPVLEREGIRSLAFVPLTHQGRLIGKFMVYHEEPHAFTADELRLAGTIASHLAFGIARVRAEEDMRASEARFRTLLEQSPLSMQVFRMDGACVLANEAWARMWDLRREGLERYNILRDAQIEAEGLMPAVRRAFAGEVVDLPPVLYDPSGGAREGRARWVRALFFPLRRADGTPREVVLVLEDVTAKKRAADALRENEGRLGSIIDSLAEGIVLFDADARVTRLNPAAERILACPAAEMLGARAGGGRWTATRLDGRPFGPDDHPVLRALRTGEPCADVECAARTPDGRDVVLSVNAVPLHALDGRTTGVAASFVDATHRKAAEAALRKSELWLRTIFDSLDAGVLVVAWPERRIANANAAVEKLFGYRREELVGGSTRVLHVDDAAFEEHGRRVSEALATGGTARFEFVVRRKDGSKFPSEQTVSLLRNPDGSMLGGLAVIRDVTAEKQAMAELEAARRQVANTEKLSALGSLVSGVAHEIRTPLAYITNHLFLIQQRLDKVARGEMPVDAANAEVARHSAAVMEGIDRINRIVGELRRFTRLKGGERAASPLDAAVLGAVELFRATSRGRMQVEADLQPTAPLPLDPLQVQQVVLNLLDNAADAMGRTGTVHVATRPTEDGAELVVRDHGQGIPPDVQARMFDPLFTTKQEGTGLGLSIVRRIVEAHAGTLRCETAPGKGTTFTILFPHG